MLILGRQRVLFRLLEALEKPPKRLKLAKLLFLASKETKIPRLVPFYDFLPYRYGPYSFVFGKDLETLANGGYVRIESTGVFLGSCSSGPLPPILSEEVEALATRYGAVGYGSLIDEVYERYPEYTVLSRLPQRQGRKPKRAHLAIYTVGYQDQTIDGFLNGLIQNGIQRIIDVRRHPFSHKFGFSKGNLNLFSSRVQIDYFHFPTLGVPSSRRKSLENPAAFDGLFSWYEKAILSEADPEVIQVSKLLQERPSALLCFEKAPSECHRSRLAEKLSESTGLPVIDLGIKKETLA